jgi:hypothetical protein
MVDSDKSWKYWEDLPPEKEDELIEKIARFFVKHKMGLIGQMIFESFTPISRIFSELAMNLYAPFLEFMGADTFTALFRKRENIQRLIDRIEELEEG